MSHNNSFIAEIIKPVCNLAEEAGAVIMAFYKTGHAVDKKEDASVVTEADRATDKLIVTGLRAFTHDWPIVSEEGDKPDVSGAEYFWLVDPLDSTTSFVSGSGYFTVNIGLIEAATSTPVLGALYDPANQVMYWGSGNQAFRKDVGVAPQPIHVRKASPPAKTALLSHSFNNQTIEDYLTSENVTERIPCASSIKFAWLAEGRADIYPRIGRSKEWDIAAGHAILLAAGGTMTTIDGKPFLYGKPGFLNGDFVAYGAHM